MWRWSVEASLRSDIWADSEKMRLGDEATANVWEKRQTGTGSSMGSQGEGDGEESEQQWEVPGPQIMRRLQSKAEPVILLRWGQGARGDSAESDLTWLPFHQHRSGDLYETVWLGQGWDEDQLEVMADMGSGHILGWSVLSTHFLSLCSLIWQSWAVWGVPSYPLPPAPRTCDTGEEEAMVSRNQQASWTWFWNQAVSALRGGQLCAAIYRGKVACEPSS